MQAIIEFLSQRTLPMFLINVTLQSTLLIAIAMALSGLFRHRAAAREFLLRSTLFALLACPLITGIWWFTDTQLVSITFHFAEREVVSQTDRDGLDEPRVPPAAGSEIAAKGAPKGDPTGSSWQPFSHSPPAGARLANSKKTFSSGDPVVSPEAGLMSDPEATQTASSADNVWPHAVLDVLLVTWAVGAALGLVRLFSSWVRIQSLLRRAQPSECERVLEACDLCASFMGTRKDVRVAVTEQIQVPMVAGIRRHVLLLPPSMATDVTADELEMILLHELAHVHRNDNFYLLWQRVLGVVWWFNPVVHWFNRQLTQAREEVCDNYVLARTDGISYGEMLLRLARRVSRRDEHALAIGFWGMKWNLEKRISGILHHRRKTMIRVSTFSMSVVSIAALALIVVAAGTGVDAQVRSGKRTTEAPRQNNTDSPNPVRKGNVPAKVFRDNPGPNTRSSAAIPRTVDDRNVTNRPVARNQIGDTPQISGFNGIASGELSIQIGGRAALNRGIQSLQALEKTFRNLEPSLPKEDRPLAKQLASGVENLLKVVKRFNRQKRLAELEAKMQAIKAEIAKLRGEEGGFRDGPRDPEPGIDDGSKKDGRLQGASDSKRGRTRDPKKEDDRRRNRLKRGLK